ncbi:MAG: elongation factor P [Candidatus Paceibacterota bacterium]
MSLGVNELKPKTFFILDGQPYMVLETHHLKMQQRRPVVQTRMRNLLNGKVIEKNFAQSDVFEEANITRQKVKFLYNHKDEYWFSEENEPSKRFKLEKEIIGDAVKYLKANTVIEAIMFNDGIITIELPIKMEFKVKDAPPAIRGDTAQGGVKQVVIETGATINVPLFVETGDVIRVNTQSGDYVERVTKG